MSMIALKVKNSILIIQIIITLTISCVSFLSIIYCAKEYLVTKAFDSLLINVTLFGGITCVDFWGIRLIVDCSGITGYVFFGTAGVDCSNFMSISGLIKNKRFWWKKA